MEVWTNGPRTSCPSRTAAGKLGPRGRNDPAPRPWFGSKVADIGAGHGFFSVRFSPIVGEQGRVYAVEIDPSLVDRLKQRTVDAGLANIEVISATAADPNLPSNAMDAVLIADVYHEISDTDSVVGHLYDSLKPGGTLIVVDYMPGDVEGRSREEQALDHAIAPEFVLDDLRRAGFHVERAINPFITDHPDGLAIYAIIAKRE